MRMTKNKAAILEALTTTTDDECLEWGAPPRSAATVAAMLDKPDHRPTARTLRLMEQQGLVVAETRGVDVWCAIAGHKHYEKQLKCYWPAEDLESVRAGAQAWCDGADERKEKAWQSMKKTFFG